MSGGRVSSRTKATIGALLVALTLIGCGAQAATQATQPTATAAPVVATTTVITTATAAASTSATTRARIVCPAGQIPNAEGVVCVTPPTATAANCNVGAIISATGQANPRPQCFGPQGWEWVPWYADPQQAPCRAGYVVMWDAPYGEDVCLEPPSTP